MVLGAFLSKIGSDSIMGNVRGPELCVAGDVICYT